MSSEDEGFPVWQKSPLPGQKGRHRAKKGGGSSFSGCGLPPFSASDPFPPAFLRGYGEGWGREGELPAVFVFGACPFARATSKRIRTTDEMGDDPEIPIGGFYADSFCRGSHLHALG